MANRIGTRGREVQLYTLFTDANGNPINADRPPQVTITDSYGNNQITYQSGLRIDRQVGLYQYSYLIPIYGPDGYYTDTWTAYIGGVQTIASFQFQVLGPGDIVLGAPPVFSVNDNFAFTLYNEHEAYSLSVLLTLLKSRVKNNGYTRTQNGMGGYTITPCNVFTDTELTNFIINSLSNFNMIPHFTHFKLEDREVYTIFADIIVQGAELLALSAQAIIEKAKEYSITDNGITYNPPFISEVLMNQYNTKSPIYEAKLKFIKASIKPRPLGLGTFTVGSGSLYPWAKLRSLRERQIF